MICKYFSFFFFNILQTIKKKIHYFYFSFSFHIHSLNSVPKLIVVLLLKIYIFLTMAYGVLNQTNEIFFFFKFKFYCLISHFSTNKIYEKIFSQYQHYITNSIFILEQMIINTGSNINRKLWMIFFSSKMFIFLYIFI